MWNDISDTLRENNLVMKSLQSILMDMKQKWESEQRDTMTKFDQAKKVVLSLRRDSEAKKVTINGLEAQLKEVLIVTRWGLNIVKY